MRGPGVVSAQEGLLSERLDELTAASSRVGRRDWLFMVGGVSLAYALESALSPEAARDIVETLFASIEQIVRGMPRGLPGG